MRAVLHRLVRLIAIAVCISCVAPPSAMAQKRPGMNDAILEEDTSKSYALPYGLVILGVTLGVLIIARPGTRADAPRQKVHDESED